MAAGTAYAKRWGGNFADGPGGGTPIDSTFLNAVETALLQLIGSAPTADGQVAQWDFANTRFGPALLLNKNIDPAAAIAKSKLDFTGANGIVNADIAGAAAIAPSKIAGGVPKITASLLSGGPPGSPADGDIWIALAVDTGNLATTNGTTWTFRYNASSGSSFKWEFIGGSHYRNESSLGVVVNTQTQVGATGFWFNGNMGYTTVRAGDYRVMGVVQFSANGAAVPTFLQLNPFAGAALSGLQENSELTAANDKGVPFDQTIVGATASQSIGIAGHTGVDGTIKFANSKLHVVPVRIS